MLKNSIIIGGIAAVAMGLSTMGAMARGGGGGGFGGGGGHGGGGGGFHGGGGGFHGGGGHFYGGGVRSGGIRGYRSGYNHNFRGRRFAAFGPYGDYGYGYGDDCYLRRGRWVCDYY